MREGVKGIISNGFLIFVPLLIFVKQLQIVRSLPSPNKHFISEDIASLIHSTEIMSHNFRIGFWDEISTAGAYWGPCFCSSPCFQFSRNSCLSKVDPLN